MATALFASITQFNQNLLKPAETHETTLRDLLSSPLITPSSASPPASEPASSSKATGATERILGKLQGRPLSIHGFKADARWALPDQVTFSDVQARPGYHSDMLAHEYNDEPQVLRAKAKLLADLVRRSKNCLVYSGAGISTSSGIDDYATRADETVAARPKLKSPWDAQPTRSHHVLTQMYHAGYLKYWVQQNHDGLPQKAGFPQHAINEIHGAWYDPSNPVVKMGGNLRGDLFTDLLDWEQKTDLVLTLGTSLAGMNADRLVHTASAKAKKKHGLLGKPKGLGSVIVGLQQTPYDEASSLRVYSRLDDFMLLLSEELGLSLPPPNYLFSPDVDAKMLQSDIFTVPYNTEGKLDTSTTTTLDLREGQRLVCTAGPYRGAEGKITGKNREGHYKVTFMVTVKGTFKAPWPMVLGSWWIEAAVKGTLPFLPVISLVEK